MPFADFMRLALYCPKYGYYEQDAGRIGRRGDYLTSVSVSRLFGDLLGFQFAEWLEELPGGPRQIVEAGAHDGRLAADILEWLSQERSAVLSSLEYWIIEPSPRRRTWQAAKLEKVADRVRWVESSACLVKGCAMDRTDRTDRTDQTDQSGRRRDGVCGVIFCNELLDSFPVHRWAWDATARIWFAWGVTLQKPAGASKSDFTPGHQFAWQKIPIEAGFAAAELEQAALQVPAEILAVLPD